MIQWLDLLASSQSLHVFFPLPNIEQTARAVIGSIYIFVSSDPCSYSNCFWYIIAPHSPEGSKV